MKRLMMYGVAYLLLAVGIAYAGMDCCKGGACAQTSCCCTSSACTCCKDAGCCKDAACADCVCAQGACKKECAACKDMSCGGMKKDGMKCEGKRCSADNDQMKGMRNDSIESLGKALALTPEQKSKIKEIRTALRSGGAQRMADLKALRQAKQDAMQKNPPDFETAKSKGKEIAALMAQHQTAVLEAREKEYALLSPEQKDKYAAFMGKRHKDMREPMKK